MREALARSTNDFVQRERLEPRAARPRQDAFVPRASDGRDRSDYRAGLMSSVSRLPVSAGKLAFGVASLAVTLAVVINALALQDGDHPNPLFGAFTTAQPAGARTVAARPADAVVAKPPPAPVTRAQDAASPAQATRASDPIAAQLAAGQGGAAPASRSAVAGGAQQDAIADLLRAGGAPLPPQRPAAQGGGQGGGQGAGQKTALARQAAPAAQPAKPVASTQPAKPVASSQPAAAAPTPSPQVTSAQKALARLGFGQLTADGLMGPGTRAAIERFQKARGLPVTGELGPATLKALSAPAQPAPPPRPAAR